MGWYVLVYVFVFGYLVGDIVCWHKWQTRYERELLKEQEVE